MSNDVKSGADKRVQSSDKDIGKHQLKRRTERPPLPWNRRIPAQGIELKPIPVKSTKSDAKPALYESPIKALKPRLVSPRLSKGRLPWLDGKSPSLRPTDRPHKASIPGVFVSDTDASHDNASPPSSATKSGPKTFLRANTAIRSVGSTPLPPRKLTHAPLKRRISSITPTGPLLSRRTSLVMAHGGDPSQEETAERVEEPSRHSSPQSLQSAKTNIVGFETTESPFSIISRASPDVFNQFADEIEEPSPPQHSQLKQDRSFPLLPKPTPESSQPSLRKGERLSHHQKLQDVADVLDRLVDEALSVAEDAADQGKFEELDNIVQDSTKVSQTTSEIRARHLMAVGEPLKISTSSIDSSTSSSGSSSNSYSSSTGSSRGILNRAAPLARTSRTDGDADKMPSRNHVLIRVGKDQIPGGYSPKTSPGSPNAVDWAYVKNSKRKKVSSSSSSTNSSPRHRSRFENVEDASYEPERVVDFVTTPSTIPDSHHGRPHRRQHRRRHPFEDKKSQRKRSSKSTDYPRSRTPSSDLSDDSHKDESGLPRPMTESSHSTTSRYSRSLKVRDHLRAHRYSLHRHSRRQPIARNWSTAKKRVTATIACINTSLLGIIVGIYAGEVPRIQYQLADETHAVILGNLSLYLGLALSTLITWPLPLLHGRKPYILGSLAIALPLQFPQALVVGNPRSPEHTLFKAGLLLVRGFTGIVLGFANVNFITTLFDLFGASLQSKRPHQELVIVNDVRRHGGGMGMWLGVWSWCSIGSMAVGFQIGAGIIESLNPDWGFYIVIILMAVVLVLNILVPETRRSQYRRSVTDVYDRDENYITRRVSQGEIKLHISTEGPKYWFEEVWAGIRLCTMMMCQAGFAILAFYLGWIYAQIVLVIVLLGALLSREYRWHPQYVGLGVMSVALGALLAVPLTKAGIFSRERKKSPRTDSMTLQREVVWSSHFARRILFMLALPLVGLAYTVSSSGRPRPYMVPVVFAGAVAFFSVLAMAECHGLIMETYDTCDLQPGVNTRHRLQSMAADDRRRRTNYSSFPRISAGIFLSQTIGFILAAAATAVGGILTRHIGAQASIGVTAGILLFITIALTAVLWRFRAVQVIPNHAFGTRRNTAEFGTEAKDLGTDDWKPVIIGNPSGKMRRMSILELGTMSRWTEVRRLNKLLPSPPQKRRRIITT